MNSVVRTILGLGVMTMAILSGCGGETQGSGSGGSGGAGGGGAGGAGGSGGSGSGADCGGIAGLMCPPDEYCEYSLNQCGAVDQTGVCALKPQGCPEIYMPVCACGGMVFGNECEANAAGHDVTNLGGCTPPDANLFGCGHIFCTKDAEYCQKTGSDVGGEPDSYACKPYPAACMAPAACDCLVNEPCGSMCEALPDGQLKITCLGG